MFLFVKLFTHTFRENIVCVYIIYFIFFQIFFFPPQRGGHLLTDEAAAGTVDPTTA